MWTRRKVVLGVVAVALVSALAIWFRNTAGDDSADSRGGPALAPRGSAVSSGAGRAEPESARVRVLVQRDDRTPLSGATVMLVDPDAPSRPAPSKTTGADGKVVHADVPPGVWRLTVLHPEHAVEDVELTLAPGQGTTRTVTMRTGVTLVGTVTGPDGSGVAAPIHVIAGDSDRTYEKGKTRDDGSYRFEHLPPVALRAYVHDGKHRPAWSETVRFEHHGQSKTADIELVLGKRVRGVVLDDAGSPVAGASVGTSDEGGHFVRTGDDGRFEIGGMGDDAVALFAVAEGFAPARAVEVVPGSDDVTLRLVQPASVRVVLTKPAAVYAKACRFEPRFGKEVCHAAVSQREPVSELVLRKLAPGDYDVVLERDGRESRHPVSLESGKQTELTVP